VTQLTPSNEDPYVHELLASLKTYAPSPGFADRVMSQVWQPAPTWVRGAVKIRDRLFNRKRAWAWAGALAATSAVSVVTVFAAIFTYQVQVATAWAVGWTVALEVWRFTVGITAAVTVVAARWLEPLVSNGSMLVAFAATSLFLVAMSAFGLQRTIRQYRSERVVLHAGR